MLQFRAIRADAGHSPQHKVFAPRDYLSHHEAEPATMDEALSEYPVVSLANPALQHVHANKMTVAASAQHGNEGDRTNVEICSAPEVLTAPIVAGSDKDIAPSQQLEVLHVGCGTYHSEKLPQMFRRAGWREIRLDIDAAVNPDFVASITDMQVISDSAVHAVYSSHNVEHLYPHEVPLALREMTRVLKSDGFAFIKLPDLQEVARFIADGKLEDPLYISPMGAIAPLDILYGHRPSLERGNLFMAHRTGFTATTLAAALIAAGFAAVIVQRDVPNLALTAIAFRTRPDAEQTSTWQARLLPAADRPTVLYTLND